MKKPVYRNPKTGKLWTIQEKDNGETVLLTVYDNAKVYDAAETKADKKGRAYKVLDVELQTTKAGFEVFRTVKA